MSLEPADGNPAPYRCKHNCERDELMDRIATLEAEIARKDELCKTYRQAQLTAEQRLCREQANATGWKKRAEHLEARAALEARNDK